MAKLRALVALELGGSTARQSEDARRGLELWSDRDSVDLEVVDVTGSLDALARVYRPGRGGSQLLLGPYGSGLVRRTLAVVGGGLRLWNHGGSADDLARPWAPMVLAPASTYLAPLVDLAVQAGCTAITLLVGRGRFAATVARGAENRARQRGLAVETAPLAGWTVEPTRVDRALLVAGTFEDDIAVMVRRPESFRLVGCVAAGIPDFEAVAGEASEGVFGPVQWLPGPEAPEVGPSGTAFARWYRERHHTRPSYVAVQAAAGGYLAAAAARLRIPVADTTAWSTSTMLGRFRLSQSGLQIGHRVAVVRWRKGAMEPVSV